MAAVVGGRGEEVLNERGLRQLIYPIREAEASDPHGQRWPRHEPHDACLTHHSDR
jgi:hypothetical protein